MAEQVLKNMLWATTMILVYLHRLIVNLNFILFYGI